MRRSAAPWASAMARASSEGTSSSSEPCTTMSGRGASRSAASAVLNPANWSLQAWWSGGNASPRTTPVSREWRSSRSAFTAHSPKSAGAPTDTAPRTSPLSAAARRPTAPPVPNPATHTPVARVRSARCRTAARTSSTQPSSEKSPSESPQPR